MNTYYIFTNNVFKRLYNESQDAILTKDAYQKLMSFESFICQYMRENVLPTNDLIEAHRLLALISTAQIKILEDRLQTDLDNDGKIGVTNNVFKNR